MARETSIEAYREIKENGLLSKRRWEVYALLFESGPLTALQIITHFREIYGVAFNSGNFATRLSELRDRGAIKELGTINRPLSGNRAILWDVTKELPKKLLKPKRIKCKACRGRGYVEQGRLV